MINTRSQLKPFAELVYRAAFEIVALAAGWLGAIPLAAQSVIMTTDQSKDQFFLSRRSTDVD